MLFREGRKISEPLVEIAVLDCLHQPEMALGQRYRFVAPHRAKDRNPQACDGTRY